MNNLEAIFSRHKLWPAVKHIIQELEGAGFLSYLAGGCIRDALLGQAPKDFDIATSARPDDIIRLFPDSNEQGKTFGVVAVFCHTLTGSATANGMVEVATFRKDGPYTDGRHPRYVEFLSDKEDALRRDFTVNALFYHLKTNQIIDYVDGCQDLEARIIRTVGSAEKRFQEDRLRILRALRFSIQLGFDLDPETKRAIFEMKDLLWVIAKERIYAECVKMLQTTKFLSVMETFKDLGLLKRLWPILEQADWQECMVFWKKIKLPKNSALIHRSFLWTCAFYPLLMQLRAGIIHSQDRWFSDFNHSLKTWKFPSALIRQIHEMFIGSCQILSPKSEVSLAKKLRVFRSSFIKEILFLSKSYASEQLADIKTVEEEFKKRAVEGMLPSPLVTGNDLKALGIIEGKNMARDLDKIYDYQLEQQITQKEKLLKMNWWKDHEVD